jgi:16S rRNA (cytosine1402-N4)-methyltransferase
MAGVENNELNARDSAEHPLEHASPYHAPVLCNAVIEGIVTEPAGTYVDATMGGGGHTAALLSALEEEGRVIGLDRDPDAIEAVSMRLAPEIKEGRLRVLKGNFSDADVLLKSEGIDAIDGALMDLGVSSHQLNEAARGFSFRENGPLDMRMDREAHDTAAGFLNESSESEIVRVLRLHGEEPRARAIGRAIVKARPLESTQDLVHVVESIVFGPKRAKTMARVFQAIRIAINDELAALEQSLVTFLSLLKPGGRLAVISYHSLEDRRVKRFFRTGNFAGTLARDIYGNRITPWIEVTRRPVMASEMEQKLNPRSRSARLRIAERLDNSGNIDIDK